MKQVSHGAWAKGARVAVAMAAFAVASASHAATPIVFTTPDYTGTDVITDTTTTETVGAFDFSSVPAFDIASVTISGDWGNPSQGPGSLYGSANDSLFADGIEVATCHSYDLCYGNGTGPVAWSYTFTSTQVADLAGKITLVAGAGQDGDGYVYGTNVLSDLKVTVSPVPEPASVVLMLGGLGLVGLRARRRTT